MHRSKLIIDNKGIYRKCIELKGHLDSVDQLVWSPVDPNVLATASVDKSVILWDIRSKNKHYS